MKKLYLVVAWMLCCLMLVGCGDNEAEDSRQDVNVSVEPGESGGQTGNNGQAVGSGQGENVSSKGSGNTAEYYDIATNKTQIFDILSSPDLTSMFEVESAVRQKPRYLGMQYYKEEAVQLWGVEISDKGAGAESSFHVYLCKTDGSSQMLFRNVNVDYKYSTWFLDEDGNAYVLGHDSIAKLDTEGNMVYERSSNYMVNQICQINDGKIYMLVLENGGGRYKLAELNTSTGSVDIVDELGWSGTPMGVGRGTEGLIYMDNDGFWQINTGDMSKSSLLLFEGSSYYADSSQRRIQDFRQLEDGSLELLRSNGTTVRNGNIENMGIGELETLKLVDVGDGKTTIVMRGMYFNLKWTKEQVVRFNESQEKYYVVLDEWPEGSDEEEFVRRTGVEIATGKGPDILCGELLEDSIYSLIQKGVFENLKPYLDKSGIREEDYFPMAFSSWRDGEAIYSINTIVMLDGYRIDEAVLGGRDEPDVETLMDALLAYEEDAFYLYNTDSQELLRMFLEGSEDLWGMIDWEKGTCDFSGELFAKLLEVSKRYGYNENFHYPAIAESRRCDDIILFDTREEQEKEGKVPSGVLFDDGCYAGARAVYFILAMNANSPNKEGAWEFLNFLLGEEAQAALDWHLPVYKKAFDDVAAEMLTHVNDKRPETKSTASLVNGEYIIGVERSVADLTEEKIAELKKTIEEAKPFPIRTTPILDIIDEEAAYYFNGVKSIDEVRNIIENRVGLYLDENR